MVILKLRLFSKKTDVRLGVLTFLGGGGGGGGLTKLSHIFNCCENMVTTVTAKDTYNASISRLTHIKYGVWTRCSIRRYISSSLRPIETLLPPHL